MRHRAASAFLGATTLTLLLAGTALAGGWAMATQDPPPDDPGGPNQPITIGFTLLQHGVAPVDWGSTHIAMTNEDTGQTIVVAARQQGAKGHWVAEISLPADGTWTYEVRHDLEIVTTGFAPVTVGTAAAASPAATARLGIQPALLLIGAFLALLAIAAGAAGFVTYRHARLDRARA